MRRFRELNPLLRFVLPALVLPLLIAAAVADSKGASIQFNRDIRPILSENCFPCHGADSAQRKAGLRLDRREEAVARRVIVPGDPSAGKLIQRIFSAQPTQVMPPVSSHKRLAPAQKDLLKRWIAQGAKYEAHWSFNPPKTNVENRKSKIES